MPQCHHVKDNGARCGGAAQRGQTLCNMHDPARRQEMQDARSRGGKKNRKEQEPLPDFSDLPSPKTLEDVAAWQARVAEALVRGQLDPRRGHEMTYGLRALVEVLQATESAEKAEKILEARDALKKLKVSGR